MMCFFTKKLIDKDKINFYLKINLYVIIMNYSGNQIYINVISGGLAGSASLITIYPSEYLKTQRQFKYNIDKSLFEICKNTFKNQGLKGFYKGMSNLLYLNTPRAGIQFSTFEASSFFYKQYFSNKTSYLMGGLTSGFASGLFAGVPAENLKVFKIDLFNNGSNAKLNFYQLNKNFIAKHGIKSYYNGGMNGVLKESISQGTRFFLYATIMESFIKHKSKNDKIYTKKSIDGALVGGLAGGIGAIFNNPMDVVQTRLQSNYNKKYKGMFDCYKTIYRDEGIKSFYKGCLLRTVRTAPGMMVYFYTYESLNFAMQNLNVMTLS
jgi:solute carrier family 25 (mitochondrial citrate transporter), member 1